MPFFVCSDDRVNDYQHYGVDAVESCSKYPDMGAQVHHQRVHLIVRTLCVVIQISFSGCLIENLNSLADNNHTYGPGWSDKYRGAMNSLRTSGGFTKLDFVSFTYHHALTTLIDRYTGCGDLHFITV